jgi:glycosyltransferase involved in cell wall biosynthesis
VIAHDFAEIYGGAERTIAAAAAMYPDAPFYAILGRRSVAERMGVASRFHTLLPPRRRLLAHFRLLTPLFPALVGSVRLPAADVLLTSSYAFAHGFTTENDAPQLCYCHSPLRFAWTMTEGYQGRFASGPFRAAAFRGLAAAMRTADRRAASRVRRYVANSQHVADQLHRFYGVEAEVVHAPVDTERFHPPETAGHDDYFLLCGRLIEPYKRPALAVEAFASLPHRLLIAGDGPAYPELRRIATPNVEFLGHLDQDELRPLMQRCAAAIFPSRDDFGLVPLEVAACGRPTIAFGAGGALETVIPGETGELFEPQDADALAACIRAFEPDRYSPERLRSHAERFSIERFRHAISRLVADTAG